MENEIQVKQKHQPWVPWLALLIWFLIFIGIPYFLMFSGLFHAYQGDVSGSIDSFLNLFYYLLEYQSYYWLSVVSLIAVTCLFFMKRFRNFFNILEGITLVIIDVLYVITALFLSNSNVLPDNSNYSNYDRTYDAYEPKALSKFDLNDPNFKNVYDTLSYAYGVHFGNQYSNFQDPGIVIPDIVMDLDHFIIGFTTAIRRDYKHLNLTVEEANEYIKNFKDDHQNQPSESTDGEDWDEFIDVYEDIVDEQLSLIKKLSKLSRGDTVTAIEYSKILKTYTEVLQKAEKYSGKLEKAQKEKSLSPSQIKRFVRIHEKMLKAAASMN